MSFIRSNFTFHRFWQRLMTGIAALTFIWVMVAASAFIFVKHQRGFSEVRFADMALPFRWSNFKSSLGRHYLVQAEARLQVRDFAGAMHLLRAGLAKAPDHRRGRLLLADLYRRIQRPDRARETLLEGLPLLGDDPAYLGMTLDTLAKEHADAEILRLVIPLLTKNPSPLPRSHLAQQAAEASYRMGHYDQAEQFLNDHNLMHTNTGVRLLARIDWARDLPDLALARLDTHLRHQPGDTAALGLQLEYLWALHRFAEWQTSAVSLLAADPLGPGPQLAYLRLLDHRRDERGLDRQAAVFISDHRHDPAALLQLAGLAVDLARPALARKVHAVLAPDSEACITAALLVAEACLAAGQHAEARDLLTRLLHAGTETHPGHAPLVHGLLAIALHGRNRTEEAGIHLARFLASPGLQSDAIVAVARRLDAIGARDPARAALRQAFSHEPPDPAALALLTDYSPADGDRPLPP